MESYAGGQNPHSATPGQSAFQQPHLGSSATAGQWSSTTMSGSLHSGIGLNTNVTSTIPPQYQVNAYSPSQGQHGPTAYPPSQFSPSLAHPTAYTAGMTSPYQLPNPPAGNSPYLQHQNPEHNHGVSPQSLVPNHGSPAPTGDHHLVRTHDAAQDVTRHEGQTMNGAKTGLPGSKKRSRQERSDESDSGDEDDEVEVVETVKRGKRVSRKDPFKKYGRIFCRLGGMFTPVIDFVQAGVDWEIGHQAALSRSNTDLSTTSQPEIDLKEVKDIEPIE
ncbi:hypothetical protein QCA50_017348 [Cerrena zonata]|uniref:Uncharacterized protein n=1 Tax=Cerrena zonata TaxID=2478898 RepID=A0AAW0FQN5_9APHY